MGLITRTVAIPFFGPAAGEVLPVGVLDLLATLFALALIAHRTTLLAKFPELEKEPLAE